MLAFSKSGITCARMQNRSFCVPERDHVAGCGGCEYEFGSVALPLRGRGQIALPELALPGARAVRRPVPRPA
jgi:hypothetical protein